MERNQGLYLDDIIEAIERIEKYSKGLSFEDFSGDIQVVDAVVRNFGVIGEAAKNISMEMRQKHPDIPWKEMAGMRDKLIHEYFGIKKNVLWETIKKDLPKLKPLIQVMLEGLEK